MCIWNKILVGLICLASPFFFYLAARSLSTSREWRECADKHAAKIAQLKKENERLFDGFRKPDGTFEPGVRQLRVELHKLLIDRRRAWFQCVPNVALGQNGKTAEVTLTIDNPSPPGIAEKTVLYAFEDADVREDGRYLGEYAVIRVDGNKIVVEPTKVLTSREAAKLEKAAKANRPWTLYELMPQDSHEVFASLSDEEKRALLPASSVSEYLKDGKPASDDDPEDRVVDGKYVRQLIDYSVLFNHEYEKQTLLRDSIEAVTRDKKLAEDALALGREQEEACKRDIAAATKNRAEMIRQREIVTAHMKKLQEKVAEVREAVESLIMKTKAMAGQIAKFQLEATRLIDSRTRAMARSDSGRP